LIIESGKGGCNPGKIVALCGASAGVDSGSFSDGMAAKGLKSGPFAPGINLKMTGENPRG
jgi:hypothetical protein